jgi:hypothetical protein
MTIYRQGDVLIHTINRSCFPKDAKVIPSPRIILADGEVTGHHHVIVADRTVCEAYEKDGMIYLHVEEPVDLTHEEHAKITIPPGDYVSYIQREYDPIATRRVAD